MPIFCSAALRASLTHAVAAGASRAVVPTRNGDDREDIGARPRQLRTPGLTCWGTAQRHAAVASVTAYLGLTSHDFRSFPTGAICPIPRRFSKRSPRRCAASTLSPTERASAISRTSLVRSAPAGKVRRARAKNLLLYRQPIHQSVNIYPAIGR
jgi:hypothetical protein